MLKTFRRQRLAVAVAIFTVFTGAPAVAQSTPTLVSEATATPTVGEAGTLTATPDSTPTSSPTDTPSPTETATPTETPTPTETGTPTETPTPTETGTPTPTPTQTPIPTARPPRGCLGPTVGELVDCGDLVTCFFAVAGDTKAYRFSAEADDVACITTAPLADSVIEPAWMLVTSRSQQVPGCFARNANTLCCRLPSRDTYSVIVRDFGNNEVGGYSISLQGVGAVNRAGSLNCATRVGCGAHTVAEIHRPGDSDAYRFAAAAGDAVRISTAAAPDSAVTPRWQVFGPDGNSVDGCSATNGGMGTCTGLSQDGTYTMLVYDRGLNDAGAYSMSLQFVSQTNCCATPIAAGESLTGFLRDVGQMDAYAFEADQGGGVTINTAPNGSAVEPRWRVFDPSGRAVANCSARFGGLLTCSNLPLTGTYAITVDDLNSDATGGYNLSLQGAAGSGVCFAVTSCTGDCNMDGQVTVDELLVGIGIGLGYQSWEECPAIDKDGSEAVSVDELVAAVTSAVEGCP